MIGEELSDMIVERDREIGTEYACSICGIDLDPADVRVIREGQVRSYVCPGYRGDN